MNEIKRRQIIADNITYYRKQRGITQKELAKKIGISASTMTDYMKLRSAPSFGVIQKLADFLEIKKSDIDSTFKDSQSSATNPHIEIAPSPDAKNSTVQAITDKVVQLHPERQENVLEYATEQLDEQEKTTREIQEEPAEYNSDKIVSFDEYRKKVPEIVDFAASAGTGVCQEDNLGMEVMFYEDELAEDYDSIGIVMGSSMEPVLKNGDYIFVKVTTDIPNGAISIWQVNGENYVKKFRNNRRPYLESLNPEYDDIDLDEDDNIRPLGVVVDVYREN
ncbi:helix-turn-helix domain-containing protein [Streptococcus cuniculi]|uniref:Helix-turn-helix domain-containing protein n=1 Tax=Streptococcus cuniculi TaxID=1432788 RepID=A0A4Y9JAP9_9STRE|nr:S24 family peptidase [Streptococcus cuniculi]MBF0778141.1 helix-turn-helix domain-containing protein [Streptococcus cuniculi]TFU97887.1 helix-turn-helix domain-containing protein [Streptococcus cuniculi]